MKKTALISNNLDLTKKIRIVKIFVALRNTKNSTARPDVVGKDLQDLQELSGMLMWHDSNHMPDEYVIEKLDKWISLHANHDVVSIVTELATMDLIKEMYGKDFIKESMRKFNIGNISLYVYDINNIIGPEFIRVSSYKNNKSSILRLLNMDISVSDYKIEYNDNVKHMEENIKKSIRK
ncbi:MAG: hypothetical protein ACRC23_01960 [Aeromonas jandaei]